MTAKVITRTEKQINNEAEIFIDKVISVFTDLDCNIIFKNLIGQTQQDQKIIIKNFQTYLQTKLNELLVLKNIEKWEIEFTANRDYRDSIDLYLEIVLDKTPYKVIVELDKNRADQIAKKFLSRTSHTIENPTIYFAFCYPGTAKMNSAETKKYFKYCLNISNKINTQETPKIFVGIVVEENSYV